MATVRNSYTLDPLQLEGAFEALRKASDTFRLTPLETRLYRWLGRCAKLAIVAFIATVAANVVNLPSPSAIVPALVFVAAGGAATLLLLVNLSLVGGAIRQRRLLKKLGLHAVWRSAWKAERRRHVGGWIGGAALTTAGAVLLILGGIIFLFLEAAGMRHGEYAISAMVEMGLVALFALPGATVLIWRMVERSREQLAFVADVDHLRAMLTSMQAESGSGAPVVVPAAVMEQVAGIENAQIARERAHAVVASVRTVDRGYGLVLAHDVTAQKAALARDERLAVEELIDQVLAEPQAPGNSDGDGLRRASTPDGLADIDYRVDEPTHRVHVVGLRVRGRVRADY